MDIAKFSDLAQNQFDRCKGLLFVKGNEYAFSKADRLAAFKKAAALQGETPSGALYGMLAKHLVSLAEMCGEPIDKFTKDRWAEKITDSMNYLVLLWALVNEESEEGPGSESN